jgi:hypothetical protein
MQQELQARLGHGSGIAGHLEFLCGTGPTADHAVPPDQGELTAYGPLVSDNSATRPGTAVLARARPRRSTPILIGAGTPASRCTSW